MTDVLEVHFLELPRLRKAILDGPGADPLTQWMLFIDGESQEVMKMLAHDNKDIRQAYTLLEVISQDKHKRMAYEAREAELMDQRSRVLSAEKKGREEGIVKGREEGVRRVAETMLSRGMPVDDVADITGMDRNTLASLQNKIPAGQEGTVARNHSTNG